MKRLGFANKFILSMVTFFLIADVSAEDPSFKTSWFWESHYRISKQAAEYLFTHPLNPILPKGEADFNITGFESSSNEKIAFPLGQLKQGKETYALMFATVKKPNGDIEVDLLCLAKLLNNLPAPQLFMDVLAMASVFKPAISEMKPCYVFMEPYNGSRFIQTWTFFNPKDKITLFVTLKPDDRGGTYFSVSDKPIAK